MSRGKHWCFTLNNPLPDDKETFLALGDRCDYVVFQLEKGEEGTLHLQGCLGFKTKKPTFNSVKQICDRAHWELSRSPINAIQYCQKEESRVEGPWIVGEIPTHIQGKRNDLNACIDMVRNGKNFKEILETFPQGYARNYKALHHIQLKIHPDRTVPTRCFVFWGPTGCGKTTAAFKYFETPCKIIPNKNNVWYDRYDPVYHKTVIFDDFYGNMPWNELLNLCDWSPHSVQTKGGMLPFTAKTVIFTSNKPYNEWYKFTKDFSALERRFEEFGGVIKFNGKNDMTLELGNWPAEFEGHLEMPQ